MQDGQNLFFSEEAFLGHDWALDDTSQTLRAMSAVEDFVIVGIYSENIAEPDARDGSGLVELSTVGVCGTDVESVEGKYGWAGPGQQRLVLGQESWPRY